MVPIPLLDCILGCELKNCSLGYQVVDTCDASYCCRGQIAFLSNLASIAKQQSFGRAGLMSLAECIASAANDCQTEWREDAGPNIVQEESASESVSHNDKTVLLDALRFVVECGKQHFNPNYRLRGLLLLI